MTQRLSKFLLALEAILLVAPITFLFTMIASEMLQSSLEFKTAWQLGLLTFVIIATSLGAGWSLMFEFWRNGPTGLRKSPFIAWAFVLCGGLAALVAAVFLATADPSGWLPAAKHSLSAFVFGLPLLVPLCHLLAERFFRSAANNSPASTRKDIDRNNL
jgi:hypothetical protein